MKIFLISLLTFTFVLSACQKEKVAIDANSDNPFYETPLDQEAFEVPCTPYNNSINYGQVNMFYSPYEDHYSNYSSAYWALKGYNYYGGDIDIDFKDIPATGEFLTTGITNALPAGKCFIRCHINGILCIAEPNGTVYVKKNLNNSGYTATFCELQFTAQQGNESHTVSGNLKSSY